MELSYAGEIRLFTGDFAPDGWAICDGSLVSVVKYALLFELIGTTYGGDGLATFGIPDLRGRIPIHFGQGNGLTPRTLGEIGGIEAVTLRVEELPVHTHVPRAQSGGGNSENFGGNYWSGSSKSSQYVQGSGADTTMNSKAVDKNGDNHPHDNMMPFLAINFIISLNGLFPPPN